MKRVPEDRTQMESVDLAMPGVGEIVGESMKIDTHDELTGVDKVYKLDPTPHHWYTDRGKYVQFPH